MKQFYITVKGVLPLIIIPDGEEGNMPHPTCVHSYRIYHNYYSGTHVVYARTNNGFTGSEQYLGTIVYLIPGRSLEYIADGAYRLGPFEIQEVVDRIDEYRDTPALWELEPMKCLQWYLEKGMSIQAQIKKQINSYEQAEHNFIENQLLIKTIAALRMEYNLVQEELHKYYPCLV